MSAINISKSRDASNWAHNVLALVTHHHSQHGVNLHWQAGPQQTHQEQHGVNLHNGWRWRCNSYLKYSSN